MFWPTLYSNLFRSKPRTNAKFTQFRSVLVLDIQNVVA